MTVITTVVARMSDWGWLIGFAGVSVALVVLAVLLDALYEDCRQWIRKTTPKANPASNQILQMPSGSTQESSTTRKKAA